MSYDVNNEQKIIQTTVGKIASEFLLPVAGKVDEKYLFNQDGIKALGKAGFMGTILPSEYGGSNGDTYSFILALEEISKVCASTALSILTHTVASQALAKYGDDETKLRFLPGMATGEKIGAFAVHETASGVVAGAIQTKAKKAGDFYVLNGSKFFVTNGGVADYYVTLVRTDISKEYGEFSLLLVEKQSDGFSTSNQYRRMGLNGTSSTEVFFEDCKVSEKNLLGEAGSGLKAVVNLAAELALPGMSAIAAGLAQASLEASITHALKRRIGEQPIAMQPPVQLLIAEMGTIVEAIKGMMALSFKKGTPLAAFQTKLFVVDEALRVTDMALQVHGGHGYTKEIPVERYYRDARGLKLHFMTSELLKLNIGKMLLGIS